MIPFASIALIIVIFVSGFALSTNTAGAVMGLGFASLAFGILIAAAQTRGFEGYKVLDVPLPFTWEKLWMNVRRLELARDQSILQNTLYVQTPRGPLPLGSVFTARINGELALVFDTAEDVDHAETFNALKQGVM